MSNADDPDVGDLLPGESGSAVLICHRSDRGSALTFWPSLDQALEAAADLATPSCGPDCVGVHAIAYGDRRRIRVMPVAHESLEGEARRIFRCAVRQYMRARSDDNTDRSTIT